MTNEQTTAVVRRAIGRALGKYTNPSGGEIPSVLPIADTRKEIMHCLSLHSDELSTLGVIAGDLGDVIESVTAESRFFRKESHRPKPYWDEVAKCAIGPFKGIYWVRGK